MTINGRVVAISRVQDNDVVADELRLAIGNDGVDQIALCGIEIDDIVIGALVDLLTSKNQQTNAHRVSTSIWHSLRVINCTGDVGKAILTCTTFQSDVTPAIAIKHVEIDRQLVDKLDDFSFMRDMLMTSTTVESLRLSSSLNPDDVSCIADGLASNSTLLSLDLRWTQFENDKTVEVLARGLTKNDSVKCLNFTSCNLTDGQMSHLINSVQSHPSLETVIFQSNDCGRQSSEMIASLLTSSICNLKKLDLGFQLRNDGNRNKLDCRPIIHALEANMTLQILDLTCNRLDDTDASILADALTKNATIEEVFLTRNEFTEVGIETIARHLPKMKNLKKLSLWGNKGLTENSAGYLLKALKANNELQILNLFRHFKCSHQIQYLTTINQGGRKLFQSETVVPLGLWPFVMERANKLKLTQRKEDLSTPDQRRIEMIFHLLKGLGPLTFEE